ncbi:MAG TPA: alpha-amylase family glycosyl hydrolase [Bacilli bacterium]|nr:alpha-amylase family glycosyl hydrolase [Bacilli bacterium]
MKLKKTKFLLLLLPLLFSCTSENSFISTTSSDNENPSSTLEGSSDALSSDETSSELTSSNSETVESSLPEISYVQVFAPTVYSHVYAWVENAGVVDELVGTWPGALLKSYDENWRTYDFQGYTALNIIFNVGSSANQTADLTISSAGYYWYYQGSLIDYNPGSGSNTSDSETSQEIFPPVEASSWQDFAFWDEYPSTYWNTVNKYSGSRTDFRNESIYFTITTRFYDGDSSNNTQTWDGINPDTDPGWRGDFKGLIEKMDYIKALGFTAIWITPIVRNASGYDYHGYHAINFQAVDERYLSSDVSFQDVINAAHSKDMKIILDVVFNHTGNFGEENIFPMFTKQGDLSLFSSMVKLPNAPLPSNYDYLSSGEQYDARIAAMKNTRNDGSDPNYIYHHYGNFSWETFGEQLAQIAGDCVDLNTENPLVAEYIVKSYGEFIKMGVDAFRIDTMKHISRLTFNNYIFPALYEFADRCGNDNFYMFGEVATRVREVWNRNIPALSAPFYTWKEEKSYPWGDTETNLTSIEQAYNDNMEVNNERTSSNAHLNGVTYHAPDYSRSSGVGVIDFPMHWNFQYARDSFNLAKGTDQYYNDATYNVMYVDSHDYAPDGIEKTRYIMGTSSWAENMALMFTFRGVPCIYYGSEIEFQKGKTIDEGPNILLSESGRAYYGDHLAGTVTANGFGSYNATGTVATTLNSTLSQHLIKLNKIRQSVPALSMGQYTTGNVSGDMAYIRRYTSGSVDSLALVAVSGGATFSSIPNGTYVDVVTGDTKVVSNGSLTASFSGQGNLRVYVLENASTGTLTKIGGTTTYLK